MPPKKPAADSADPPQSPSSDTLAEKTAEKRDAAAVRKLAAHPSTAIMVKEALKELDSRKGVSYQAIQNYIKQKYPTVDMVRLKHLVRRALKKGLETGTLVRPANATVTTGALGKFRLAPKAKESKPKSENVDPNVGKVPKVAKDGVKKPKTAGVSKTKSSANGDAKTLKDPKPLKKSKKEESGPSESGPSKPAPAKRPKAKKAEVKGDGEGSSDETKTEVEKTTKGAKTGKAPRRKAAKAGSDAASSKATGKRGKKTE